MKKADKQKEIKAFSRKCDFYKGECIPLQKIEGMELKSHCYQCYKFGMPTPSFGRELYDDEDIATLKKVVNEYKRELAENCKFAKKDNTCGLKDCFDMCAFCDREFTR